MTDESAPPEFKFHGRQIPTDPGVYLFYDAPEGGNLLYVGKAKHLRKRVSSYFRKTKKSPKTQLLVTKVQRIETRIVASEEEALILENNLIKANRPRFNILLRDDKTYLYLRITAEPIPRMMITRRLVRDGSFYAGPKTSSREFRQLVKFLQKIFGVRTCRLTMELNDDASVDVTANPEKRKLPCLDHHLRKCTAPCTGAVSPVEYKAAVTAIKQFLRGDTRQVEQEMKSRMTVLIEEQKFEAAAKLRDQLLAITSGTQRQRVEFPDGLDRDFFGLWRNESGTRAHVVRLVFRRGKWIEQSAHAVRTHADDTDADIVSGALLQLYPAVDVLPHEVYLPCDIESHSKMAQQLQHLTQSTRGVHVHTPQKGEKLRVIETANRNARHAGEKAAIAAMSAEQVFTKALPELTAALNLPVAPRRIEGFDISHLQGTHTVASMVVFTDGKPDNGQYRRFRIKDLKDGQIDDYAALHEVLRRRFVQQAQAVPQSSETEEKSAFAARFPDLLVIDGGKGQLSSVMRAVDAFDGFPPDFDPQRQIISLAKREEEIFRPGEKISLRLPKDSPALMLLQRVRDESHRFAITHNRALRVKAQTKSVLDAIPGIGGVTRKKLIAQFGSARGVAQADDEQLREVLSQKQLDAVRRHL